MTNPTDIARRILELDAEGSLYVFCEYCGNTGQHFAPDVAELVMVTCSKKGCSAGVVRDNVATLARAYLTLQDAARALLDAVGDGDNGPAPAFNEAWYVLNRVLEREDD